MRPYPPVSGSQSGFSLIEVMVASAILGMIVSAMIIVLSNTLRQESTSDHFRQARLIIKEEIEDPQRNFYLYPPVGITSTQRLDANPPDYNGITASLAVVVDPEAPITVNGIGIPCHKVRAQMTWVDNDQKNQNLTLRKLVTPIK